MSAILHFGETAVDFLEVADLWPEEFGSFYEHNGAQGRVADALRAGTLLQLRDEESQTLVAAAAIDLTTFAPHMFVPFVLVRSGLENELNIRRQLNTQILRLALVRGVNRLMFHITKNEDYNKTISEMNDAMGKSGVGIKLEINGDVDDLYGDGRTISTVSLFIEAGERPELMNNVVRRSNEFYKNVLKYGKREALSMIVGSSGGSSGTGSNSMARIAGGTTGGFGGTQAACCSGCNEDNKTDKGGGTKDGKEAGKDGKDSKDGVDKGSGGKDGVEFQKLTPEKVAVDISGVFADYAKLGVQQFDRTNRELPFMPLA